MCAKPQQARGSSARWFHASILALGRVERAPRPTGVCRAYLAHLLVEVLLQTCNALKCIDVETYTAAGGREDGQNERTGQGGTHADTHLPQQRHSPARAHMAAVQPGEEAKARPSPVP